MKRRELELAIHRDADNVKLYHVHYEIAPVLLNKLSLCLDE